MITPAADAGRGDVGSVPGTVLPPVPGTANRQCPVCGTEVPPKPESQPGPQPRYCGRECQMRDTHRKRNRRAAALPAAFARIAELEAEVAALRAVVDLIDWARVPATALGVAELDRWKAEKLRAVS